jgi:hypothetical protein
MKIVRLENNVVTEIIPEYALPVDAWYGKEFAAQCVEAPDDVRERMVYNQETKEFSELPEEPVEPQPPDPLEALAARMDEISAETKEMQGIFDDIYKAVVEE